MWGTKLYPKKPDQLLDGGKKTKRKRRKKIKARNKNKSKG